MMNLYYHVTDVVKRHIDAASRRFSMLTMISVKQMSTILLTHMDSNVYTIFAQSVKVTYTEIHTHHDVKNLKPINNKTTPMKRKQHEEDSDATVDTSDKGILLANRKDDPNEKPPTGASNGYPFS